MGYERGGSRWDLADGDGPTVGVLLRAEQMAVAAAEWEDETHRVIAHGGPILRSRSGGKASAVGPPPIVQPRLGVVLPVASKGADGEAGAFVPALLVDGWRFPCLFGPHVLLVHFDRAALPAGHDGRSLAAHAREDCAAGETVSAPASADRRAGGGGRWPLMWQPWACSTVEARAWGVNGTLLGGAALVLLDLLLVSSDVKWSASTSRAFGLALVHTLLTADAIKVGILTLVASTLSAMHQNPKSMMGKCSTKALRALSSTLQAIL
jgi:hypothetical protein